MKVPLLLLFSLVANCIFGQNLLEKQVNISLVNATVEEALYALIDGNAIDLSFSNNILPKDRKLSLNAVNQPLQVVLDKILEGTDLAYKIAGSQVVIFKKEPQPKQRITISGYVRDMETGERIIGATVYDAEQKTGTYSNEHGFFSITLAGDKSDLIISSLGYDAQLLEVPANSSRFVEVAMSPTFLAEVVVRHYSDSTLMATDLGNIEINLPMASKLAGGEADIMRLAYTLPGFQAGADGFGGISVRGGNVDQNLFLLDGVPVYNAMHGIGIFSIYNSSAVRSAKILKGAFPAKYGGRVSSVWDIQTKAGNSKQFQGELDMGLSSGKLTLEGPFAKKKGSVFLSARRAFFDFFSEPITRRLRKDRGLEGSLGYFFYDTNFKLNYHLGEKDQMHFTYYRGRDLFSDLQEQVQAFQDSITFLVDDEDVKWGNSIAAFRWNHRFSDKLFGSTSLSSSKYIYQSQDFLDLETTVGGATLFRDILVQRYNSNVKDISLKFDFDYSNDKNHLVEFGGGATGHRFEAGIISFEEADAIDTILVDTLGNWAQKPVKSVEFFAYLQDEIELGKFVKINLGLRLSGFRVHEETYLDPQPRLNVQVFPMEKLTAHFSASRVVQFLHLLSPTSLGLPKDLWVTATERIPPQSSWQFLAGVEQKLPLDFRFTVEGYFRTLDNLLIFKESSVENVTSTNWQDKVSRGNGRAYGPEFLLLQQSGKFGGWLGYTLGWSDRNFPPEINRGNRFPTKLDRRHNFNLQFLYKMNDKWDASLGFAYATGSAFNFPAQEYEVIQPPGSPPTEIIPTLNPIDQLNGQRMPPYHRLDLSVSRHFWQRTSKHTIIMGVYNAYNRRNPLYFSLRDSFDEEGNIKTEVIRVSLLPIFPSLRYVLEFK